MGVSTTADERKWEVGVILQEQPAYEELTELIDKLSGILDPNIWGGNQWSEEFKTRVKKDIRKIDNFIDHLQKMRTRY